jgi:hypothetical protein
MLIPTVPLGSFRESVIRDEKTTCRPKDMGINPLFIPDI